MLTGSPRNKKRLSGKKARFPKPSPSNLKAQEKRALILQAAVETIAKKGYHQGTITDIARQAKISYGLVYNYFRNKEDIVLTLFRERWERFSAYIEETKNQPIPPDQKMIRVGNFLIRSYEREPNLMKVLVLNVVPHSKFFEINKPAIDRAFRLIQKIYEEGQRDGFFDRDLDSRIAVQGFYGGILQILVSWIQGLIPDSSRFIKRAYKYIQNSVESCSRNRKS